MRDRRNRCGVKFCRHRRWRHVLPICMRGASDKTTFKVTLRAHLKALSPFGSRLIRYPDYHCCRMTKERAKQSGDRPYCGGSSAFAFWAASALRPLNGVEDPSLRAKASGTLQYLATRAHRKMISALA